MKKSISKGKKTPVATFYVTKQTQYIWNEHSKGKVKKSPLAFRQPSEAEGLGSSTLLRYLYLRIWKGHAPRRGKIVPFNGVGTTATVAGVRNGLVVARPYIIDGYSRSWKEKLIKAKLFGQLL